MTLTEHVAHCSVFLKTKNNLKSIRLGKLQLLTDEKFAEILDITEREKTNTIFDRLLVNSRQVIFL